MRYVVDTHALAWYLTRDPRLGNEARQVLADPAAQLVIPTIVLAETKYISEHGRISISFDEVMRAIVADARISIFPLDVFVVSNMPGNLDIHDGLIVATAFSARLLFAEEIAILTRDKLITTANLLPAVW